MVRSKRSGFEIASFNASLAGVLLALGLTPVAVIIVLLIIGANLLPE